MTTVARLLGDEQQDEGAHRRQRLGDDHRLAPADPVAEPAEEKIAEHRDPLPKKIVQSALVRSMPFAWPSTEVASTVVASRR